MDDDDDDYGHYSIIAHIDKAKDELIVVDPYKDFVDQSRIVKMSTVPEPLVGFQRSQRSANRREDLQKG